MKHVISVLCVLAVLLCMAPFVSPNGEGEAVSAAARTETGPFIVDAGHGGEDGGAVSADGTQESGINLAIALRLEDILAFCGAAPVMLRREDISLHDQDLSGATLISVHQNSYPESRYDGAQVFYAPTEGSQALAEYTQEILRQTLDPDNGRQAKQIPDTVYLMNHIDNRAILVECGFLSNPQEAARLRDPVYQTKIAAALASACLTFQGERITAHTTEI